MITLTINDMTCGGCVASITRVVKSLDPTATLEAEVAARRVSINTPLDTAAVVAAISNAGYHPEIAS